jgi:hypothetical protein
MAENRNDPRVTQQTSDATVIAAEILRSTALTATPPSMPAKGEEKLPVFWRVFGATLLSIAALVIITLCQHFAGHLNELHTEMEHISQDLRKDIAHLNENDANLVKKEDFNSRITSVWNSIKDLQTLSSTVVALKEKSLIREEQLREQEERKELVRELQRLRERLAMLEGRQEGASGGKSSSSPSAVSLQPSTDR